MCVCLSGAGSAPDQLQGGPGLRLLSLCVTSTSCTVWACFLLAPASLAGITRLPWGPRSSMISQVVPCSLCQVSSRPDHSSMAPGPPSPTTASRKVLLLQPRAAQHLRRPVLADPQGCPLIVPSVFTHMSTGTCVPLRLSGSFVLSLGFQAGWARVTQNSSSLGLLLLTRILKVPVLPSRPGLSSHLSCRSQLSTLLPYLATISCLCGCPGRWGFVQAFSCWYRWEPQGPQRPGVRLAWRTLGRER